MSRDEGFAIADIDSSKLDDAKFKALWRAVDRNEVLMNAACVIYEATQLASWRAGERWTADDSAPAWVSEIEAPIRALVAVRLLDAEHRLPRRSWAKWFHVAKQRREVARDRWRRSKRDARQVGDLSTNVHGVSTTVPRGRRAQSLVPSVPTVPTVYREGRSTRPRARRKPESVGSIMEESLPEHLRAVQRVVGPDDV